MASLDREAGVVAPLSQCKPDGYLLSRPPVTTLALHSEVRPTWPCTLFDLNGCHKRPAQVQTRFGRVSPEMEAVIDGTEVEEALDALCWLPSPSTASS